MSGDARSRPSSGARLIRLLGLAVCAWLALVLVGSTPALAHATVVTSTPANGADLAVSPTQVSITFDESVGLQLGYLRVIDSTGRRVDTGTAFHPNGRSDVVAVTLPPGLPTSAYVVSYRVVSADSHPVGGVVQFTVGGATPSATGIATTGTASTDRGISLLLNVARSMSFLGLAVAGGWWLLLWIAGRRTEGKTDERRSWPRRSRLVVLTGLGLAMAGAALELLGQGPYAAGLGVSGLWRANVQSDTIGSTFGRWHLAQIVLLAILVLAVITVSRGQLARHRRPAWVAFGGLWLGVLICVAATGHAAARSPIWLGEISIVLHLIAVTGWIGGLVLLGSTLLVRAPDDAAFVLPVFSKVALVSVVTIAVTGAYQAWREVGPWSALVTTEYGALVLVKIGLFAVLIGLGAFARRTLQGGARTDDPNADSVFDADADADAEFALVVDDEADIGFGEDDERRAHRRLRRGVLCEVALAFSVLVVSGVLVAQIPGRTSVAQAAATRPASRTVPLSQDRELTVSVDPAQHGTVVVTFTAEAGQPIQQVTASAALPARSIGPIPLTARAVDALTFRSDPVALPAGGEWEFTVNVQISQFEVISTSASIKLR